MGPRTRPPESAGRVGERHGGPDCAPRICITSRSQARRDHRRTDSSVSVSAEAEASSSLFQPHHGGRDPTSPLASASRRGCCINPRPAHWSRSKDGVEKAEASCSAVARPARPRRSQPPQRPSQRARPRFSQTALCNSHRPERKRVGACETPASVESSREPRGRSRPFAAVNSPGVGSLWW